MTDIHCHLLYGVDDGASDIQESVELLQKLKKVGFNKVIITPHFIFGTEYDSDNELKLSRFNKIKRILEYNHIDIEVFLGNEIFINDNIDGYIEDGLIMPLANTKYLLIEFPFHNKVIGLEDILYNLTCKGYIPIIAHPERYTYFQSDYKLVDSLKNEGVLFQCNYASILGYYGKNSEKLMKYLLKKKYVDYLGTDLHKMGKTYVLDNFEKIEHKIKKITGSDYYQKIMDNCEEIVNN